MKTTKDLILLDSPDDQKLALLDKSITLQYFPGHMNWIGPYVTKDDFVKLQKSIFFDA